MTAIVKASTTTLATESSASDWETLPAVAMPHPSLLTDKEWSILRDVADRKRADDDAENWERYSGAEYRAFARSLATK